MLKFFSFIIGLIVLSSQAFAEGTKEFRPLESHKGELCIDTTRNKFGSVTATVDYRLHIHISDYTTEAIYFGFGTTKHNLGATTFRFYRPDNTIDTSGAVPTATGSRGFIDSYGEAVAGPTVLSPTTGYWALRCTPDMNGDYYLAFKITWATGFTDSYKTWENFDVTVVKTTDFTAIPGRLWSKAWQLYSETPTSGSNNRYYGKMFVYSLDSIVTKVDLNGIIPGTFTVSCNHSGCYPSPPTAAATARKSVASEHTFPEYNIFLNNPDSLAYPSGVLGGLDNTIPITAERDCDGTVDFTFGCTKAGNVELKLLLSTLGPQYVNRTIPQSVNLGLNTLFWDGNDGSTPPNPIPNGAVFNFIISYVNGLTHLPLYDVEFNSNGFYLDLVRPTTVPPPPSPLFYWDDSGLSSGTTNFTGCLPAPPVGCHQWTGGSSGFGNNRTINTWWYAVSTDSDPVEITEKRTPASLGVISGNTQLCQGSSYTFSVGTDPSTVKYCWTYPGGVDTTLTSSITIIIPANAPPGPGSVTVQGLNLECGTGPVSVLSVTINPFPTISITGQNPVCVGSTNVTYTTQSGQVNYLWTIPPGANLVSGGGLSNSFVTLNWINTGVQNITVNYINASSGCTAATPYVWAVDVNPLPVPTFTQGDAEVCAGSVNNVYATETGNSIYLWVVSAGGNITDGGGTSDPTVTVQWNIPGPQSVSVRYTDAVTNCASASPVLKQVNVKPLPDPAISGPSAPCSGSTGNVYTTEAGKLGYVWSVSSGGAITAGGTATSSSITVTWNTTGPQSVSVNYTDDVTLCTAASSKIYNIDVKPLPIVGLDGPNSVCLNNPGPLYATETGNSGYTWNITPPSAGNITAGAGTSEVNVTWTSLGTHEISVNYTNAGTGCSAAQPRLYSVTVNTLPVPSITGDADPCSDLPKTYNTQSGAGNYLWVVSPGGTITSGGETNNSSITINWTIPGPQTVSVNYTIGTGCTGATPTIYDVLVHQSTPPVITGPGTICETNSATYTTQASNTNYTWTISSGGSFSSGTNGSTVVVNWNTAGANYIDVNFTNNFGCTAPVATRLPVVVNSLPVTAISQGANPICTNGSNTYQTIFDPGVNYIWTINPAGRGSIATGNGSNAITVNWLTSGPATISLLGTNNSTLCFSSSSLPVTVNPSPELVFTPCFDEKTTTQAKKFTLRGAAPYLSGQGVFTGNRVSLNAATGQYEFDPFGAGPGAYPITYTYKNAYQCSVTAPSVIINVVGNSFSCGGDLSDVRDGNRYKTSLIGGKCWMRENLRYGNITDPPSTPQTDNCVSEKYCLPSDANCNLYGGLYQWDELMAYNSTSQNQGLCPPEWHVPTEGEWQAMIDAVSLGISPPADGVAGSFIKDALLNPGFFSLTKGLYYLNNTWAYTNGTLTGAMYWTSTPSGADRAVARGATAITPSTSKYAGSRGNSFSVRCVKD